MANKYLALAVNKVREAGRKQWVSEGKVFLGQSAGVGNESSAMSAH